MFDRRQFGAKCAAAFAGLFALARPTPAPERTWISDIRCYDGKLCCKVTPALVCEGDMVQQWINEELSRRIGGLERSTPQRG